MKAIWTMYKFRILGIAALCLVVGHALTAALWGQGDRDVTAADVAWGTLHWGWAISLGLFVFIGAAAIPHRSGRSRFSDDIPILDEMAEDQQRRVSGSLGMGGDGNDTGIVRTSLDL
jgi:hypothetical protein